MSLTITTDVFCDGDGCMAWTHGVTHPSAPQGKVARRVAAGRGWVRRRIGTTMADLCPDCAGPDHPG